MNEKRKSRLRFAVIVMAISMVGSQLRADTLVTLGGKTLTGKLRKTPGGYAMETAAGRVEVPQGEVKQIRTDPVAAAAVHGHRAVDPAEVASLLDLGKNALAAGDFAQARDYFKDAAQLVPQDPIAARGLGIAYLKLDKPLQAAESLKVAAPKPVEGLDRTLTMAISSSLVASPGRFKLPMRAVNYLMVYLKSHPQPDEPVLNALATALFQAQNQKDSPAARSPLFTDAAKLYNTLSKKLEENRRGEKRWGITWDKASVVDQKWKDYNAALAKRNKAGSALSEAQRQLNAANQQLSNATLGMGARTAGSVANAQSAVASAQTNQANALKVYQDAEAELSQKSPDCGEAISLENVDLLAGPLAMASPSQPEPKVAVAAADKPTPPAVPDRPESIAVAPVKKTPSQSPATPSATPPAATVAAVQHESVGFAVGPDLVVTAACVVDGAGDIQIETLDGNMFKAEVSHSKDGVAVLKVKEASLPFLPLATAAPAGKLTCLGLPDVNLFQPVAKEMTVAGRNQGGEWSVSFEKSPRLPGAPLLTNGQVVGVELGDCDSELEKVPAVTLKALQELLGDASPSGTPARDPRMAIMMITATR